MIPAYLDATHCQIWTGGLFFSFLKPTDHDTTKCCVVKEGLCEEKKLVGSHSRQIRKQRCIFINQIGKNRYPLLAPGKSAAIALI